MAVVLAVVLVEEAQVPEPEAIPIGVLNPSPMP